MPAKKQITREMILSAALALLRAEGAEAVQVKALAGRLGCSTQPIYLSFGSMDELRLALSSAAVDAFLAEVGGQEGALYSASYLRFAQRERHLFRFLFLRRNAFDELQQALGPVIQRSIAQLMDRWGIDYEQAHRLHDQMWMQAHGIASMMATEFCRWDMAKAEGMLAEHRALLVQRYAGGRQP